MLDFNTRPICNKDPSSAPIFRGKPFVFCWRCLGAFVGLAFILIINYIHAVGFAELSLLSLGFIPATIDYFLNKAKIKKPNNKVRFFTGILLGISIGGMEQLLINVVNHWFN